MDAFTIDTSTYAASNVLRLVDGKPRLITPEEEDPTYRERRCSPRDGEYTLEFSGISEPREEPNKYYDPNEKWSKPTRNACWLEFTVVKGSNLTGRHFGNKMTWAFGERATLGKFLRKLNHGDLPSDVWNIGDFLGRRFTATIAEASDKYSPIVIATVKPIDPPPGEDASDESQENGITLDQAGLIEKMAKDLWKTRIAAKQKLLVLLDHEYEVDTLDALTYEQADQLINWMDTDPAEVKDIVRTLEAGEEDAYPEVPQ
jgi:hypothetical protein